MRPMLRLTIEAVIIFVIQMVLSAACTFMFTTGVLPQTYTVCVLLALVCLTVTVVLLIISIIHKAKIGYAPSDVVAIYMCTFAFFAVITMFMAATSLEPYLTYIFLGYKVFAFGNLSRFLSALIVNVIICAVCVVAAILCNKEAEAERIRSYLKDDNGIDS